MNKIPVYMVIAILLGSVTMLIPLALLGPGNLIPDDSNLLPSPEASSEQSGEIETYDLSPTEAARSKSISEETKVASNLSSIGLITVSSFLIALGVFVYFKKRTI